MVVYIIVGYHIDLFICERECGACFVQVGLKIPGKPYLGGRVCHGAQINKGIGGGYPCGGDKAFIKAVQ